MKLDTPPTVKLRRERAKWAWKLIAGEYRSRAHVLRRIADYTRRIEAIEAEAKK